MTDDRDTQIDEKIQKLRVEIWDAVTKIGSEVEENEIADVERVLDGQENGWEFAKRQMTVAHQKMVYLSISRLGNILDKSLSPEELRAAYDALKCVVYTIQQLARSTMTPFGSELQNSLKMHQIREEGVSPDRRARREKMRPYVERVAENFSNVPAEKRAGQIKKFLWTKDLDFRKAFVHDHRTLKADISAILFPDPEELVVDDDWPEFMDFILEGMMRTRSHRKCT